MAEACSVQGCERPVIARQWCRYHYNRWHKWGDPEFVTPEWRGRGSESWNWSGRSVGYYGVHIRLRKDRGPARNHACVMCGESADEWAYDRSDPNTMRGPKGQPYSPDIDRYHPMCVSCHRTHDWAASRAAK